MAAQRSIDRYFSRQAPIEALADAAKARLRTDTTQLMGWTSGRILRPPSGIVSPPPGVAAPNIQVATGRISSTLHPNAKERQEAVLGIAIISEEADTSLPDGARSIASVWDRIIETLSAKPQTLGVAGCRRLSGYDIIDFGADRATNDDIFQFFLGEVRFVVDINIFTREGFTSGDGA